MANDKEFILTKHNIEISGGHVRPITHSAHSIKPVWLWAASKYYVGDANLTYNKHNNELQRTA